MCSTTTDTATKAESISTLGIHHLGLSVPDIKQTAAFFIEQLGFTQIGGNADYPSIFISDGTVMLTLWQISSVENMTSFDRKNNVGLHHFALKIANIEELERLHQQLAALDDVEIEFAPEPLGQLPLKHMMCLIPGGIRLELISA
jgi:catechol 2,3-dioxygenase-like lactoylglutathione lyase family enzyme